MTNNTVSDKHADSYSIADRAKMIDDYRMIFAIEGHVMPHIERVFRAFEVEPHETRIFMDYYCSQISRLDLFGTVESEFALHLKTSGLLEFISVKVEGESQFFVCAEALKPLQSDISRLNRRLKLMGNVDNPFDCFTSTSEDFQDEQYFLTQSRLKAELKAGMTPFLLDRLMSP